MVTGFPSGLLGKNIENGESVEKKIIDRKKKMLDTKFFEIHINRNLKIRKTILSRGVVPNSYDVISWNLQTDLTISFLKDFPHV